MKEINDNNFDQQIKKLMDSYSEPIDSSVGQNVWHGIESSLSRRHTFILIYKSATLVALAACLLIGVFLMIPDYNSPSNKYEHSSNLAVIYKNKPSIDQKISKIGHLKSSNLMAANYAKRSSIITKEKDNNQIVSEGDADVYKKDTNINHGSKENHTEVVVKDLAEENNEDLDNVKLTYNDDSLFIDNKQDKSRRLINIGIYSNAGIGILDDPTDFSAPSYAPGSEHAMRNSGIVPISERPQHSTPISIGAQLHFKITNKVMIGTGINFTYLYSKYEALVDNMTSQDVVRQKLYYLGVPVNLYYNILQSKNVTFYTNAGIMIEKGLKAKFNLSDLQNYHSTRSSDIDPLQWSINAGIGFEYKLFPKIGLYLDPSISYYFDNEQPYSIRTEEPLQLKADIGVRFHF